MQGISAILKLKKNCFLVIAFGGAIGMHITLLLLELNLSPQTIKPKKAISVRLLEQQTAMPEPEAPAKDQEDLQDPAPKIEIPVQQKDKTVEEFVVDTQVEQKTTIVLPSVYSESFQRELKRDAQEYVENNPQKLESFSQSFEPLPKQVLPEIDYQQGPLGGGNYKIRRGNVECEQLTVVPQSFDDFTKGSATTVGNCKEIETFKLNLNRLNK